MHRFLYHRRLSALVDLSRPILWRISISSPARSSGISPEPGLLKNKTLNLKHGGNGGQESEGAEEFFYKTSLVGHIRVWRCLSISRDPFKNPPFPRILVLRSLGFLSSVSSVFPVYGFDFI